MDSVSKKLRDLREDHDLNQDEVARIIGCNRATISNYENGRDLQMATIIAYCKYFSVSADWLLGLTTDRRPGGSNLSGQLDDLAALTAAQGGEPFTSDQLSALLASLLSYYRRGARAGNTPVSALSAYVAALRGAVEACAGNSAARVAASVNAVSVSLLDAHAILAAWLERSEGDA